MADDRFRNEHLERLRRKLEAGVAAGHPRPDMWIDGGNPWTARFRAMARDSPAWDENVQHIANAGVVHGTKGAALAPDESAARTVMPGGAEALRVPVEDPAGA
eukprot:16424535-Heterocapsa_arctica.AAC.1